MLLTLDAGHYHPTEWIADKISSVLLYVPEILLHVSRGVRWDSDHVVTLTDDLRSIAEEIVRAGHERVHCGLDFFDASINRVAAYVIGTRAMLKALLLALLQPVERLRALEAAGDFTARLALMEELKGFPFGAVWDYYCQAAGGAGGRPVAGRSQTLRTRRARRAVSLGSNGNRRTMNPNPMLGVVFHWLGGLASGSFYVPYRAVRKWSWETYWLVGGLFSWIIAPWILAAAMTNDLAAVLGTAIVGNPLVELFLRSPVGIGRADLRPDDALPGHVAGNGRGPGLLLGFRHADAADLRRHDRR